ncbi:MAG TPA: DUF192 domain-containing protein [Allosphingosinicella sp.]|jgi:hypothetical protein
MTAACQSEPVETNAPAPVAAPASTDAGAANVSPISGLPLVPLEIRSGGKTHRFTVEVAATEDEQAYGLMNRTKLGPNEGMVFPFKPARPASFWMKNTLIPLDMVFVRTDGTVARIAAMTTPHSLAPVGVSEPVAAVLEIAGGRAAELGIGADARVSWPGGPRP